MTPSRGQQRYSTKSMVPFDDETAAVEELVEEVAAHDSPSVVIPRMNGMLNSGHLTCAKQLNLCRICWQPDEERLMQTVVPHNFSVSYKRPWAERMV